MICRRRPHSTAASVPSDAHEVRELACIEVRVFWGNTLLRVDHLTPPRGYYVGEPGSNPKLDFVVPKEKLGASGLQLIRSEGATPSVVIPAGACARVDQAGLPPVTLEQQAGRRDVGSTAGRKAKPCADLPAVELPLCTGRTVWVRFGDFAIAVCGGSAEKPIPRRVRVAELWRRLGYFATPVALIASLMLAMSQFVVPKGITPTELSESRRLVSIRRYLEAATQRASTSGVTPLSQEPLLSEHGDRLGDATSEAGAMGAASRLEAKQPDAFQHPPGYQDPPESRRQALLEAAQFGLIGLLNQGVGGDRWSIRTPWGNDNLLGTSSLYAMSALFSDYFGDTHGLGGSTLQPWHHQRGRIVRPRGSHGGRPPRVRLSPPKVYGGLSKDLTQRLLRQNYGRYRLCYENRLWADPNLTGRVTVRFVIDRTGEVSRITIDGSRMPDSDVVRCILRAAYGLNFPKPRGGVATVIQSISFAPP